MIEVFADVRCPFTHVGLRRLVEQRRSLGRGDVNFRVRAWPLEVVNGEPMDGDFIAEEVDEIRDQVAPDLFTNFDVTQFPVSSLPALELAATAYAQSDIVGEKVSLMLRDALFEDGCDIARSDVLAGVADRAGLRDAPSLGRDAVMADWNEGLERGVIGSPHFFVGDTSVFCPALDINRVDGALHIIHDTGAFDRFVATCFDR